MGYLEKYRIFVPKLSVLCILQNTETSRSPLVSILLPILYRQTPNFLIFNQSPILIELDLLTKGCEKAVRRLLKAAKTARRYSTLIIYR